MNKIISLINIFSLLLSSIFTYVCCPDNQAGLKWEENIICVRKADAGSYVSYPRMLALNDGTLICAYDTDLKMACVTSNDGGLTWDKNQIIISEIDGLNCANAALIQLDSGELLCGYRATGTIDGRFYATIKVNSSFDNGKTWRYHSTVIETLQDSNDYFGVWEPHFGFIGDKLAVFYSNDSQNDAVENPDQQNIEFKLWDGSSWCEKNIASDGNVTNSRDGMPVWCQTSSCKYVMAIETTALKDNKYIDRDFSIALLTSKNGLYWDKSGYVYVPPIYGDADYAGAPYVVELPDGRLCVSMQTNEGENGNICGVLTTKKPFKGTCKLTSFTKPFYPFEKSSQQNWNGMCIYGDYLFVFSSCVDESGNSIILRRAVL